MAARNWSGAIDGVVTTAGNYDTKPTGTDTCTIPDTAANWPTSGTWPASGAVTVNASAQIDGGTYACPVTNNGTIMDGTFTGTINSAEGVIAGGTFSGAVTINGTAGATLGTPEFTSDSVVTIGAANITGGTFRGRVVMPVTIGAGVVTGRMETGDSPAQVFYATTGGMLTID